MTAEDWSSPNIDAVSLCNLALETSALVAEGEFKNTDLIIRAIAYFLESMEIEGRNYKAHLGLGLLLLGGKMYDDSLIFLENAYEMNPLDDINKYIELAETGKSSIKTEIVAQAITKKKTTVNDLLDLGNKFKTK